jgi:hypothetical protein
VFQSIESDYFNGNVNTRVKVLENRLLFLLFFNIFCINNENERRNEAGTIGLLGISNDSRTFCAKHKTIFQTIL